MHSTLIADSIDQTPQLPPLEQLKEHLRDLLLIHLEKDYAALSRPGLEFLQVYPSANLTTLDFVSGGRSGEKSFMLFTLRISAEAEKGVNPVNAIFGLECVVRTLGNK